MMFIPEPPDYTPPPTTAKELYEKYQSDLHYMQNNCSHEKISDWMWEEWAPGHGTGYSVMVCEICNKVVDRKPMHGEMQTIVTISE